MFGITSNSVEKPTPLMCVAENVFRGTNQLKRILKGLKQDLSDDEFKKELEKRDKTNLETALFMAVQIGNLDAVELLVSEGADIDAKNFCGQTPLMIASVNAVVQFAWPDDKYNMVKLLVKLGANTKVKTFCGDTIFQLPSIKTSADQELLDILTC
tara:strand:+ start:1116 stop:1583 length:468 start_codon:yes stop_codon:yes gene_type:complete